MTAPSNPQQHHDAWAGGAVVAASAGGMHGADTRTEGATWAGGAGAGAGASSFTREGGLVLMPDRVCVFIEVCQNVLKNHGILKTPTRYPCPNLPKNSPDTWMLGGLSVGIVGARGAVTSPWPRQGVACMQSPRASAKLQSRQLISQTTLPRCEDRYTDYTLGEQESRTVLSNKLQIDKFKVEGYFKTRLTHLTTCLRTG